MMPSTHKCPKTGCDVQVPQNMLACRTHWFDLPRPLRQAIKATYRKDDEAHGRNVGEAMRLLSGKAG